MVTTNATPCCTPGTSSTLVSSVITITGLGDHDQPDWLITMTGIRNVLVHQAPKRFDRSRCGQFVGMKWSLIRQPGRANQACTSFA